MEELNNRLSEQRKSNITQYCSIMIFLLAISFVLIITNPPPDLLEYDNQKNMSIPKNISWSEMSKYGSSILIFTTLFSLLSFLTGLLMSIFYELERGKSSAIFIIISMASVFVLALLVYPYYGGPLAITLMSLGFPFYLIGASFSRKFRGAGASLVTFKIGIISLLILAIIIIGGFVLGILPVFVVIALLLIVSLLWFVGIEVIVIDAILKWRRKHKKKKPTPTPG